MECCPTCGQTLPSDLPINGIRFGAVSEAIVRRVHKAGTNGIRADHLFNHIYGSDPNGGPATGRRTLCVLIHRVNDKLARHGLGQRIVADPQGGRAPRVYRLVDTYPTSATSVAKSMV